MEMSMFADDGEETLTNDELTQIARLAEQQLDYERRIADLNEQLSDLSGKLEAIQKKALPDAMAAVGMSEFKLATGQKVTIKEDVFASIRSGMTERAAGWLDAQGLGDVVKDTVTISLGKGEWEKSGQILAYAESLECAASEKLSVHASTLKSLVKDQLARGVEFPEELFSVMPFKTAVIKEPKK
jgi:hypothetical protein